MKLKSPRVGQNFSLVDYSDLFYVDLKIPRKHYRQHVFTLLITFQFEVFQTQVTGMVKKNSENVLT